MVLIAYNLICATVENSQDFKFPCGLCSLLTINYATNVTCSRNT